jgi:hypothetical protein
MAVGDGSTEAPHGDKGTRGGGGQQRGGTRLVGAWPQQDRAARTCAARRRTGEGYGPLTCGPRAIVRDDAVKRSLKPIQMNLNNFKQFSN